MITHRRQEKGTLMGSFSLPVMVGSLKSPYCTGRPNNLTTFIMRAIIERFDSDLPGSVLVVVDYLNGSS